MKFAMNLMIGPGMFVCSSFLFGVCMFIVSKDLLISNASDFSHRRSLLVEPLCYGVI